MKAAVITFPGSNCDDDLVYALGKICEFEVNTLWHKDSPDLSSYDLVALPGGFSYGDYLRCGSMASLSPIMEKVRAYSDKGGLLAGVCNGFQILCEARLLPGALVRNAHQAFVCKDVELKTEMTDTPWTLELKAGEKLVIPIAHGDGRYIPDEANPAQVIFTYTNNPNGSTKDIAGVCNAQKNIFGLMPHPERASDLRTKDGLKIFKSLTRYIREKKA
jgi:phosphoribosylformylglycinamidine synthase